MNKQQAQEQISGVFQHPFDRSRYTVFLRNLINHYEPRDGHYTGNLIPDAFKPHVNQYWRVGKYVDPDGDEMDLLIVEVPTLSKLERARSALRNFAVNRLKQFEKDSSLIAFYAKDDGGADWRFSFVKIEHEAFKDGKGKVKIRQELTPAKRYSYLVGEHENSHTACKQLLPLLEMDYADPRIHEIEAAFSIEKVTDEFFAQYKALFQNLAEHLKQQSWFQRPDEDERDRLVTRFAKKLLGQIVFLYFLQRKGWLGVPKDAPWGKGPKRFMRQRFDQAVDEDGNYYHDFLQYLFYEALADERRGADDPGYYERLDCRIPFLNGGLFEADYDWRSETIDIPNRIFHNAEKTKAGDTGTGILDVFDRYNFTIKEDEPLEKEVAVDPEMLGKVFENMLEVTERKSKGAFYTPREIVHYMCQESLIHYLDNRLNEYGAGNYDLGSNQGNLFDEKNPPGQSNMTDSEDSIRVPKEDIETLIRKGHLALDNDTRVLDKGRETVTYKFQLPEAVRRHAQDIDTALADIKVCDPAIGSGAFPVGLLHEIVNVRLALTPHLQKNNDSPPSQGGVAEGRGGYDLKRHAIAESIYGVDIDASAIDIARLRLWLSMIVDEDDYDTIEPLPNLDYKIVCGDSLVGFPENWNSPAFDKIETLKREFFEETNHDRKLELKNSIDKEIRERLDTSTKVFGYQVNFDFRLFFSEVWHQKNGFDIVIGNPPYVQIQHFSGQRIQNDWKAQNYDTFTKTGDIYCLFYEKGHRLLHDSGILAFITSNKWMRAKYGEKLRKFFADKTMIRQLIDFGDSPIFSEATTYTNIMLFEKGNNEGTQKVWDLTTCYQKQTSLLSMLEQQGEGHASFDANSYVIVSPKMAAIKKRIEAVGTPLKYWDVSINYGIKTGFNQAFIIEGKTKDELIAADPKSAEIIKPILRGRDIKRYKADFADLWLINTHNGYGKVPPINVNKYPAVKAHLDKFYEQLAKRQDKGKTPYNLRNCAYFPEFEKEKIVWPETSDYNQFSNVDAGVYLNKTTFFMPKPNNWLLPILNSSVAAFYLDSIVSKMRGGYLLLSKIYVETLPIIKPEAAPTGILSLLAKYRITSVEKLTSSYLEHLIDGLVYELYFPDEIRAAGKEILPHMGELTPITDDMSDEEKLAVIQREFDRLYDPNHPVRNHIETLDSVDIVRTIREALKR